MKYLAACAFLLVVTACTTDDSEAQRSVAGNKYVNPSIGTTLQFPSSWQLKTDYKFGEKTLDLAAFAPPLAGFSANVLIAIDLHQGTDNMREVLTMIKGSLSAQYPVLRNYSDTVYQVGGKDVGEMVYTTAVGGKDYRAKSVYFVNHNKEVSITYTDMADRYMTNTDFKTVQSSMSIE
jgi:hypothetical protein